MIQQQHTFIFMFSLSCNWFCDPSCNSLINCKPSQVPRHLLKYFVKYEHLAMHYIVHYTVVFHNQGGLFNSLILQALELPPRTSGAYVIVKPLKRSWS